MIDQSYFVPFLPEAGEALDYEKANDIEKNLRYLIQCWPAFETHTLAESIGPLGYLQVPAVAVPTQGVEVLLLLNLPRLLVRLTGDGLEHVRWQGEGWTRLDAEEGVLLAFELGGVSEAGAMAALSGLSIRAEEQADVEVSLAAERLDGSLRLWGAEGTRMLWRVYATWGTLRRRTSCWNDLAPMTWAQAAKLKEDAT